MDEHPEALRQRGLDDAAEVEEMLAQRQRERAGGAVWTPPTLGPSEPVRREQSSHASSGRAPAPRQRPPPAPPLPTKVSHTSHDAAGRISEVQTFEGTAAASARGWEQWIRAAIEAQADVIYAASGGAVAEILKEERAETDKVIAALEARIAMLEERLAGSRQPEEFRHAADD